MFQREETKIKIRKEYHNKNETKVELFKYNIVSTLIKFIYKIILINKTQSILSFLTYQKKLYFLRMSKFNVIMCLRLIGNLKKMCSIFILLLLFIH